MILYSYKKFKKFIKSWLKSSPAIGFWATVLHSKALGFLALRYRIKYFGRVHIAFSAKVTGWARCRFERNVVIGSGSWINVNQRAGIAKRVVIGRNSFIGRDNFMSSGALIEFGPYCLTAGSCAFIGSTHVADPLYPYLCTGVTSENTIKIGANTFFGYGAVVLGNVKIGHGTIVGAGSVVRHNVPPFSLVVGNPAVVIRHYDFNRQTWLDGVRLSDDSIMDESSYIELLNKTHGYILQPISAATTFLGDI